MLEVTNLEEQVMAVTRLQAKKASYPNPQIEKERLNEAQVVEEQRHY